MDSEKAFWSSQSAEDLHKALCQKDEGVSLASGAETWERAPGPLSHADLWRKQVLLPLLQKGGGQGGQKDPSSLGHGKSGTGIWGRERRLPAAGGGSEPFSPVWANTGDNFYTDVPGDILLSRGYLGVA